MTDLNDLLQEAESLSGKFSGLIGKQPNANNTTQPAQGNTFSIKRGIAPPEEREVRANTYSQNVDTYAKEKQRMMDRLNTFTIDITSKDGKLNKFKATADKFRARTDVPMVASAAMDVINEFIKLTKDYDNFFMYDEQLHARHCDVIENQKNELQERDKKIAGALQTNGRLQQMLDALAIYLNKDTIRDDLSIRDAEGNYNYTHVVANIQKQLSDYVAAIKMLDYYRTQAEPLDMKIKTLEKEIARLKYKNQRTKSTVPKNRDTDIREGRPNMLPYKIRELKEGIRYHSNFSRSRRGSRRDFTQKCACTCGAIAVLAGAQYSSW